MIYTVTLNPSLDYIVSVEHFKLGLTNRTGFEQILPGGKGINVSIVLKNLGIASTALGFTAGFTGDEIIRELENTGISQEFIRLEEGISRINVKLRSIDGTEINGRGPEIKKERLKELTDRLCRLQRGDVLFLSGSIPVSVPENIYSTIMQQLKDKGVMIVVDATKDLLMNVLPYHPFLIKPNKRELEEFFDVTLYNKKDIIEYAEKLKDRGARNVLVSLGSDGAVLLAEDGQLYERKAPEGKVINSVGSGDSMVAGFIAGYMKHADYDEALKLGVAAGSACAFLDGLASKEAIMDIFEQIEK